MPARRAVYLCDLSPQLRRVCMYLMAGARNKEIGNLMGITEGTVKIYVYTIGQRIGQGDRLQIGLWASRQRYE